MALICIAGVNSLDGIELSPSAVSSNNQEHSPKTIVDNVKPLPVQSIHGKLLSDVKDEMAAKLTPNAANLTEARITSITFRSVEGDADPAVIDRDSGETLSFGIRSFTVKVASAGTEKPIPLGIETSVVSQNGKPFLLQPEDIVAGKQPLNVEVLNERDNADILTPQMEHFQRQKIDIGTVHTLNEPNVFGMAPKPIADRMASNSVNTASKFNNNEHEQMSISSNGMHVEQKLQNGLYRIKIAEIITDEFNNGLNAKHANEQKLNEIENTIQRYPKPTHTSSQSNIADLFPSKMEDFASIIRDSNEQIIREKNRRVGVETDNSDSNRLNVVDETNGKHSINTEKILSIGRSKQPMVKTNENNKMPVLAETSAMRIASATLDSIKSSEAKDKETDFTSKMQVDDEMISRIEHSFRASSQPHAPVQPVIMLNKPMQFIERRVKKFDASVKKQPTTTEKLTPSPTLNQQRSDDSIDANTISPVDDERNTYKGKLPATKTLKNKESLRSSNGNSFQKQIFDERNKANETVADQTQAHRKIVMPATLETITANDQEFLFINANDNARSNQTKLDANEMVRLQNDRARIIEDSQRQHKPNDTMATNVKPSNGVHVYIMAGDSSNQTVPTNYNDTMGKEFLSTTNVNGITLTNQPNTNANLSQPTPATTSNASMPIDVIGSAKSNLVQQQQQQSNESITTPRPLTQSSVSHEMPAPTLPPSASSSTWNRANAAVNYMSKPYGRQRGGYDSFLFDTECDMQTPIPGDATLWRGNETHELNLPTTVSLLKIQSF